MHRRRAFTLVELLVVIGIIAILVGLLLPMLAGARRGAVALRCAASLRELGNAVHLYVNENKGYVPPWRAGYVQAQRFANKAKYSLHNITYGAGSYVPGVSSGDAAYWYNFLSKYLSKYSGGTGDDAKVLEEFKKSPVWGCQAFTPFPDTQHSEVTVEFNPLVVGYAWNPHPAFSALFPALGVNRPPETARGDTDVGRCGVVSDHPSGWFVAGHPLSGPWFKLTQYTRPAERALIADAEAWILEAKSPPPSGATPGQKLHYAKPDFPASGAGTGTTTFDWYRHGKPPGVASIGSGGYYKSAGGKISYNILYVDGHVERAVSKEASYRALRMCFPG